MVEYGWGARDIDVQSWKAYEAQGRPEHVGGHDPHLAVERRPRTRPRAPTPRQMPTRASASRWQVMDGQLQSDARGCAPGGDQMKAQAVG